MIIINGNNSFGKDIKMKAQTLRFLSQEDILSLKIPYEEVIDVVEKAMAAFGRDDAQNPAKIHINTRPQTYINAMPSYVKENDDKEYCGMKWIGGYPENRGKSLPVTWGLMLMNDVNTGAPVAVMDARWITAIRTAVVAAITAKYCKVKDTHTMTIIGAGEQGRWNARIMKIVVPEIKKIYIGDLYDAAVDAYITKMQPLLPDVEIIPIRNDEERQAAIDASQILITATQRSDKPFIYKEMLHKGMLGIPLESTAWEGQTYTWADRFVCDDWELVQSYLREGKYTDGVPDEYQIVGKIINGTNVGRANEDEFVITSSHGIAISDVALGNLILEYAERDNVGTVLPFMREADIIF